MLRDLFFFIWYDEFGFGWNVFIVGLFFLCLAIVIIVIARTKALNKKFGVKHYLFFVFASLIMYQIIPVCFDFAALSLSSDNLSKAIKFEKMAIKSAMIPYQKGGYYIELAKYYYWGGCPSQMIEAYKKAHEYIKSYEYIAWFFAGTDAYSYGYYDEAIEIGNHSGYRAYDDSFFKNPDIMRFFVLSRSYTMKGDFKNALIFINKLSEITEASSTLALKAYILKQMGQKKEAKIFYEKAVEKYKDSTSSLKNVKETYDDFVGREKKSLEKRLSRKCEIAE